MAIKNVIKINLFHEYVGFRSFLSYKKIQIDLKNERKISNELCLKTK